MVRNPRKRKRKSFHLWRWNGFRWFAYRGSGILHVVITRSFGIIVAVLFLFRVGDRLTETLSGLAVISTAGQRRQRGS
jgi:hypothetical protein